MYGKTTERLDFEATQKRYERKSNKASTGFLCQDDLTTNRYALPCALLPPSVSKAEYAPCITLTPAEYAERKRRE